MALLDGPPARNLCAPAWSTSRSQRSGVGSVSGVQNGGVMEAGLAGRVGPVVPWAAYPPPAALQSQPAAVDDGAASLGAPPRTSLAPAPAQPLFCAGLLAGVSTMYSKAQAGSLGDKLTDALESAVALLRSTDLPPRPPHILDPRQEFLFREEKPGRQCVRNPSRPNDAWNHHGGTGKSRLPIPPHLQRGPEPQLLIRRSGFVIRHGEPTLRFHQYKIVVVGQEKRRDGVPVLFHVVHTFSRRPGEGVEARSYQMVAAPMAAAPKRPAVGEPADSPTPAVKRLRDEESAQAAPEPEIRTIDYGQITAGMVGGGWLTTTPRQITPRQEKLFATLFSAVAFVSVVSGTVMPVTPPTGTRQLAEAEILGIYSNAHDDRLLVGVGDWRRAGARDLRMNLGHPCLLPFLILAPIIARQLSDRQTWFQETVLRGWLGLDVPPPEPPKLQAQVNALVSKMLPGRDPSIHILGRLQALVSQGKPFCFSAGAC